MTSWQREVLWRLGGAEPQPPEDGDWPVPAIADQEDWDRAHAELDASLEELAVAVSSMSDKDLRELVGTTRDLALGSGITRAEMVAGVFCSTTPITPARSRSCGRRWECDGMATLHS
jgi:hypothetical protein